MTAGIIALTVLYLLYLAQEAYRLKKARAGIRHVIHVNGTRGKSTVARLIEAGVRAGGISVFCKTTGTDPCTIDTSGKEELIKRKGPANIKEQIGIVKRASEQKADVLVVECMALQPELQKASQKDILSADIGVITNVRRDHTDIMGNTLIQICDSLSSTVPENGILFTAENTYAERLKEAALRKNSEFRKTEPEEAGGEIDFPENVGLALAVCEYLGVPREAALAGMADFKRDPYALSVWRLGKAMFINGLSINDIQSTELVWKNLRSRFNLQEKELILLINNRADRASRTRDMGKISSTINPDQVWLFGASKAYMEKELEKNNGSARIKRFRSVNEIDINRLKDTQVLFAIGNIAGCGRDLIQFVKEKGEALV